MKIFFTGSIRGGRSHQPTFKVITDCLKIHGDLLSEHVSNSSISQFGETSLTSLEILDREKENVLKSDKIFAEVTTPSLGVGYLIAFASMNNKKIILFYKGENTLKLSAIIKGDKNLTVEHYEKDFELSSIISKYF